MASRSHEGKLEVSAALDTKELSALAKTVAEANPELLKAIEEARRASEVSGAS